MKALILRFTALFDSVQSDDEAIDGVFQLAREMAIPVPTLLDNLSNQVASSFLEGSVAYEEAGQLMDSVYRAMLTTPFLVYHQMPERTLEVYEAFDAGEYGHAEDRPDDDPIEKHTKSLVAEFLVEHRHDA
jgi:hypothetical protein